MVKPERLETERLRLRKPNGNDAQAIYSCYAADPVVTKYLAWPTHHSLRDTQQFLEFAEECWLRWPAGPYLIEDKTTGQLLGSTGLDFETDYRASTGFVLAQDAWGKGYATEVLQAMTSLAPTMGVQRLHALCHYQHTVSAHVLAKGEFVMEGVLSTHTVFPNMNSKTAQDVLCFARVFVSE